MYHATVDRLLSFVVQTPNLRPATYESAALAVALVANCERTVEEHIAQPWHVWRHSETHQPIFRATMQAEYVQRYIASTDTWVTPNEIGTPAYALMLEINVSNLAVGKKAEHFIPCRFAWMFKGLVTDKEAMYMGRRITGVVIPRGTPEWAAISK